MNVTKIQTISKMKMRVFLDGEPAFAASPAQIRLWGLHEGMEMDEEQESRLRQQICIYAARTAVEILARREYSLYELEQKLRAKEFSVEAAGFALDYVRQKHYQDDGRCAEAYIRSHSGRKSRMQLRAALRGRGIAEDIIEESLRRYGPDETGIIVSDLGKRFGPDKQMPDMKDPAGQKLVQSYLRRGFRYGDIREAFQVYSKIT